MRDCHSFVSAKVRSGACANSLEPRRTSLLRLAVLVALSAIPFAAHATVYKCKKADGSTVHSDVPCGPGAQAQVIRLRRPKGMKAARRATAPTSRWIGIRHLLVGLRSMTTGVRRALSLLPMPR